MGAPDAQWLLITLAGVQDNKEMMPKAAFQFGVKAADGRKAGNKLGKAREGKINQPAQQDPVHPGEGRRRLQPRLHRQRRH